MLKADPNKLNTFLCLLSLGWCAAQCCRATARNRLDQALAYFVRRLPLVETPTTIQLPRKETTVMAKDNQNQGEGDRKSARRYNESTEKFVESKKGKKAMDKDPLPTAEDKKAAKDAEKKGLDRAREKDPQVVRDYRNSEH